MWKTKETAPKDGTAFLGFNPMRQGYVARQDIDIFHWVPFPGGQGSWHSTKGQLFTHWMPLPDPPVIILR